MQSGVRLMKRLLLPGGLLLAGLLSTGSFRPNEHAAQAATIAAEPWQAGHCYRIFPENRDQMYVFKVIEPSSGPWIRVQTDPAAPACPRCATGGAALAEWQRGIRGAGMDLFWLIEGACAGGGSRSGASLVRDRRITLTSRSKTCA